MWRLRAASLGLDYDPTPVTYITDSVRLAAGGGATQRAGVGQASPGFLGRLATPAEREHFSAQATPELAHSRYIEWLRDGQKQLDVELFTPESRAFIRRQPMTRAYNDFMLLLEIGQQYEIEEREALAMLYFTSTPFVSPHFLRKTDQGWQMDLIADMRNSREYHGGALTYAVVNSGSNAINWTASTTSAWFTISSPGGSLAAGATATVAVALAPAVNGFGPGQYQGVVTFSNVLTGITSLRPVW